MVLGSNAAMVALYWYELGGQPSEGVYASVGEISLLRSELALIRDELSLSSRRKEAETAARLCKYHYENFLSRLYVIRERIWDALTALVDVKRRNTGDKKFRDSVLSLVKQNYPEIHTTTSLS